MKKNMVIGIVAYLSHAILCIWFVCTQHSTFFGKDIELAINYVLTFPLVSSILSIYEFAENIIIKSFSKNIMTLICGVVGLLIVALYLCVFFHFVSADLIVGVFIVIGTVFILTCRIVKLIKCLFYKIRERREKTE